MLGLSFAVGLRARLALTEGSVIALVALEHEFKGPILAGDTIRVRITTADKVPSKRAGRGLIVLRLEVINQRDEVVQLGLQKILIAARGSKPAS